jgi:predicted nucleotidyltransferase
MNTPKIPIPADRIADFCRRWGVREFALFGSVLREDFRSGSDVDVLVSFLPDAHPTLFDLVRMQRELEGILSRKIDLLTRAGVEQGPNLFRKKEILNTSQVVFAA